MALLEPKEVIVKTLNGDDKTYILSKFPAIAGREIIAGYPLTGIPKIGEYKANEEIMLKLMCYVAVSIPSGPLPLSTRALVDNHVPDYETLVKLEMEMMKYNTSFFGKGEVSNFLATIAKKVLVSISPTLIPLSAQLLEAVKRRSKN
jgi:hypothetical protein